MRPPLQRVLFALALASSLAGAAFAAEGCSSDPAAASPSPDASAAPRDDASLGTDPDATAAPDAGPAADGGAPRAVTFAYTPAWPGVKSVAVIGGFGMATDWDPKTPLVTLTNDGSGTFKGSALLASGQYAYVFRVQGDAAATTPDTYERYAIDPTNPAFVACPAQSPTYAADAPNPCSELDVPVASPAPLFHARGAVHLDGKPADGYLVQLDREEAQSHHFFVNRVTSGKDGSFDIVAAAGHYRLQILHPTYLSENDAARNAVALGALRRAISASFPVSADVTVDTLDVGFHAYAAFAPTGTAKSPLPTTFTFEPGGGTRLDIYGTAMDGGAAEIGDPWFASAVVSDGGASFDGSFDTKKATDTTVHAGKRYFWGTERVSQADGGVAWTAQSMVFPITWP